MTEFQREMGQITTDIEHLQRNTTELWEHVNELKRLAHSIDGKLAIIADLKTAQEKHSKAIEDLTTFKIRILTVHGALLAVGGSAVAVVMWVVENLRTALPKIGG